MKKLLTLLATLVLCLPMTAKTNMCVQPKNGDIVRYDVEEVDQVFYEKIDDYYLYDTTAIDTSDSPLSFGITSDSTAKVTYPYNYYEDYYYLDSIIIPTKVLIEGKEYVVTEIGGGTFYFHDNLEDVKIPNSIINIADSAFTGCSKLTNIDIPASVTRIGNNAFAGSGLTHITLPNSITEIGRGAFAECTELTKINIPASVIRIGVDLDLFSNPFDGCFNLTNINVDSDNPKYSSIDGILYNKKKNILLCAPNGYYKDVVIPSSVDSIYDMAFHNCNRIRYVSIPEGITKIANNMFYNCSGLLEMTIPSTVTEIGYNAFFGCSGLYYIIFF